MALTIKIDQDPNDPNILLVDIIPPEEGEAYDPKMMSLAELVVSELMHRLHHDPENCPECQAEAAERESQARLH